MIKFLVKIDGLRQLSRTPTGLMVVIVATAVLLMSTTIRLAIAMTMSLVVLW